MGRNNHNIFIRLKVLGVIGNKSALQLLDWSQQKVDFLTCSCMFMISIQYIAKYKEIL